MYYKCKVIGIPYTKHPCLTHGMHKIKSVTAKLYEWTRPTVPPLANFCANACDALPDFGSSSRDKMDSFRFHQWLVSEVETEDGLIGIGKAAVCPPLIKETIERYLAPLVIGHDPDEYAILWEKMFRVTHACAGSWHRTGQCASG